MIKFIKNPSIEPYNMAYEIGVEVELDPKVEAVLIENGIAEEIESEKEGKKATKKK